MTTPKQALELAKPLIDIMASNSAAGSFEAKRAIDEALASLQGEDAVERVALRRIILDILNDAAPAVENLACNQEQMDADGCMVKVSRQAIEEVLAAVNEVAIQVATATSPMAGVKDDNDGQPSEQQEWQDYDRDC